MKSLKHLSPIWKNKTLDVSDITISLFQRYVRVLLWVLALSDHKLYFVVLSERIISLWKDNGKVFLVLYLKECLRLIQHYLAGFPDSPSVEGVRIGMKDGLPIIIPGPLRYYISHKDLNVIRGILTIFSVFRVLRIPGKLKINTITDPFSGDDKTLPVGEVGNVFARVFKLKFHRPISRHVIHDLLPLVSAGPNSSTSCLGAHIDAKAFLMEPQVLNSFYKLGNLLGSELILKLFQEIEMVKKFGLKEDTPGIKLGKLSIKEEAAGKVRVFAMVDVWSQSLLSIIHNYLFEVIKDIKQDGTFDQARPLIALRSRLAKKDDKSSYSFDLSAATDRLPMALQIQLLSQLLGREISESWGQLLVSRFYHLNSSKYGKFRVKYEVGQPMGALSSWAMLALTHHFIVQLAASRSGFKTWFLDYALLGDDIVICDSQVAIHYQSIMKSLGLEINLSKSLISKIGVMEFAKRIILPEGEVTPIGPKNIVWTLKSPSMVVSLFLDLSGKGYELTGPWIEDLFRSITKIPIPLHSSSVSKLFWMIVGPFGFVSEHTGFGPRGVTEQLSTYGLSHTLDTIKQLFLKDQLKRFERTLTNSDVSIRALIRTNRLTGWFPSEFSIWKLPSQSSLLRSLVLAKLRLMTSRPEEDAKNKLFNLPSFFLWDGNPGDYVKLCLHTSQTYNPLVTPGQVIKPKLPQLRDNNFKFYNKVLRLRKRDYKFHNEVYS